MSTRRSVRHLFAALAICGSFLAMQAQASPLVTYTWTTTNMGFGPHVDQPTIATFQVDLSAVQTGTISTLDILNINLVYPGLNFNNTAVSSLGFEAATHVNPVTGALIFQSIQQGLAVIAFEGSSINDATTFLSILVGYGETGSVADTFNALNNGQPYAGYPTAGYWTASLPTDTGPGGGTVPEPASVALLGLGLAGLALAHKRRT